MAETFFWGGFFFFCFFHFTESDILSYRIPFKVIIVACSETYAHYAFSSSATCINDASKKSKRYLFVYRI
jgi:hypothetical protein